MPTEIYLDTARLGRMCEGARRAEHDFARLVSRLGSPLYWDQFLSSGFRSLPRRQRDAFRGLRVWDGFDCFRSDLGKFVEQPAKCSTFVFSQSHNMIRLVAEFLCRRSNRILTTDLEWPPYLPRKSCPSWVAPRIATKARPSRSARVSIPTPRRGSSPAGGVIQRPPVTVANLRSVCDRRHASRY